MNDKTLMIIFAALLFIVFILLIIWSAKVAKTDMIKKRTRKTLSYKEKQKSQLQEGLPAGNKFWYNKEDMADATDEVLKLRCKHFFENNSDCVHDIIIEMYDCGIVKTEELFVAAYGEAALTPDSLVFKLTGMSEDEDTEKEEEKESLPPISDDSQRVIYEKWTQYVNKGLEMIEINAPESDKGQIVDELMTYGRKNLLTLMYSPE